MDHERTRDEYDELAVRYRVYKPEDDEVEATFPMEVGPTYRSQEEELATTRWWNDAPVDASYVMPQEDSFRRPPINREAQEILSYTEDNSFHREPEYMYDQIGNDAFIQDDPEEWTIESIRALTIPVGQKLQMERKIEGRLRNKKGGTRRGRLAKTVENAKRSLRTFALFKNSLKAIEVKNGTGVMSFFVFVQWLSFLNLVTFVLALAFVILPNFFHYRDVRVECVNSTSLDWCTKNPFYWLDIIQGTGVLEKTPLFYGNYTNVVVEYLAFGTTWKYDLPFAYVGLSIGYFLLSVAAVLSGAVKSFGENVKDVESKYCDMVLARWNFNIGNVKDAQDKHEGIYREITLTLEGDRAEEERKRRVGARAVFVRVVVNLVVLAILAGAAVAVWWVFDFSATRKEDVEAISKSWWFLQLGIVYEFLPSLTIVALNIVVPFVFNFLITFEDYSPLFAIRVTLMRTVVLRLFSLVVLLASLANKINDVTCWETYVGQQFYKLAITDFLTQLVGAFVVAPVRFLVFRCLPPPTFSLPKHVLDVVHLQTICWLGSYYVPFLPLLFCLVFLVVFHVKKFVCLRLSKADPIIDKTSDANSMFMVVLLLCLVFAMLPFTYAVGELRPSEICGPFRGLNSTWSVVVDAFETTPNAVKDVVFFVGTEGFALPIIIVLVLTIYYYVAKISTNSRIIGDLQRRLGQDGTKRLLQSKIREYEKIYSQY